MCKPLCNINKYPDSVGCYSPETEDHDEIIQRDFCGDGMCEGYVYKNYENFYEHENEVCYIPELDDSKYTYYNFLEIAADNKELATDLFESCFWQHPETLLEEYLNFGSIEETEDGYKYAD